MVKMVVVEVRDPDGTLVRRVTADEEQFRAALELARGSANDLLTLWIYRIIRGLLAPVDVLRAWTETFTDTTGTSRSQYIKANLGGPAVFNNTINCANRPWISYGSSSVAPTRTDYKLGSKLGDAVASMSFDEGARTITLTAGWTLAADAVVYEVGLEWEMCVAGCATCGRVLIDRTVFPDGIAVKAGQTMTVSYVITVP
jgi:hypothetical protein